MTETETEIREPTKSRFGRVPPKGRFKCTVTVRENPTPSPDDKD